MLVSTILVIYGTEFFLTPLVLKYSSQYPPHLHNNSLVLTIPTNSQSPITTGTSEHALNSEHVLRDA